MGSGWLRRGLGERGGPRIRRRVRVWTDGSTHDGRGRTGQEDLRAPETDATMECLDSRPSSLLISWEEFERNQKTIAENAHMQKRSDRKSARGGRALLTGLVRCGRFGRMMRIFYGSPAGHVHRYQCRGNSDTAGGKPCIGGAGGVRVDRAVSSQILEVVSSYAIEAAIQAAERCMAANDNVRQALGKELESARYEASLAGRTNWRIRPSGWLPANWRAAGILPWN